MKIIARKQEDAVVCMFDDGRSIEINMVSAEGEDFSIQSDTHSALALVHQHFSVIEPFINRDG